MTLPPKFKEWRGLHYPLRDLSSTKIVRLCDALEIAMEALEKIAFEIPFEEPDPKYQRRHDITIAREALRKVMDPHNDF